MGFTSAFYINLDTRPDRREHIEAQLGRAGLRAERFTAVTPDDIDPAQLAAARRNSLSPGELACSLSHRRVWELAIARGQTGVLVIEDDALLSEGLRQMLELSDLHTRLDALRFEARLGHVTLGSRLAVEGHEFRRLMDTCLGTCAYYISTEFAAQLLARTDLDRCAIDKLLFGRQGGLIYEARIYQSLPGLAAQLGMYTDGSSSAARSNLSSSRRPPRRGGRTLQGRLTAIGKGMGYFTRSLAAFAPTGELLRARRRQLRLADDIAAQL